VLQRVVIEDVSDQEGHDDVPIFRGAPPLIEEPDDERAMVPYTHPRAEPGDRQDGPTVEELPDDYEIPPGMEVARPSSVLDPDEAKALVPYASRGAMGPRGTARGGAAVADAQAASPESVDAILRRLAGLPTFRNMVDRFGLDRIRSRIAVQLGRMGGLRGPGATLPRLLGGPARAFGPDLPPGLRPALTPRRPAPPLALVPPSRGLSQNPVERRVAEILELGRPANRTYEVVALASMFPGIPATDLHALLSLPPARRLTNLRYLVTGKPAHRSVPFMAALAAAHPGVSVYNLVALAHLPAARDGDLAALVRGAPRHVSLQALVQLGQGLPARAATELIALADLMPQRTLPQLMLLGGAPAHWSGQDIAQTARSCPAVAVPDIVILCQIPAARGVAGLTHFCQALTPARTALNLVHLATVCPDFAPSRLAPVAELPGVTGLPTQQLRATAIALDRHDDLFTTAVEAHAALATPQLAFSSIGLRQVIEARHPGTRAQLMTILQWAHYTDFQNLLAIVGHVKIDTVARLLGWLANPLVDDGNRLITILRNAKIAAASDIDYLLARNYTLHQIGSWLGQPWATRAGLVKTDVNGVIPLNSVPGTGGTAGQRYSPDAGSAWPGHIYHLSMSFVIQGPPANRRARYTGFHVSWRLAGQPDRPADPRMWFNVVGGQVTPNGFAGAFPAMHVPAMTAEGNAVLNSYLTRTNCHL